MGDDGEVAQWLRPLLALSEGLSLVPTISMLYSSQLYIISPLGDLPSSGLYGHLHTRATHTHTHTQRDEVGRNHDGEFQRSWKGKWGGIDIVMFHCICV